MSAIQPAIRSAIQPAIRSAFGAAIWDPTALFAAGEQGVFFDPSDFSTMFQDSAGTTPVTATGQTVGLILDKSKGLAIGSELVTNGNFDTDAGWTLPASTTISGGTLNSTIGVSGTCYFDIAVPAGTWLKCSFTVSSRSAGDVVFRVYNGGTNAVTAGTGFAYAFAAGVYTAYILTSSTANRAVLIFGGSGFTGSIDAVSIKVVSGNHAYQATAASRLTSATVGAVDFDGTDDSVAQSGGGGSTTGFMLVAAIKPEGGAGTVRNIWSDTGTNTGYVVRINASNQLEMAVGNGSAYTTVATTATLDVGTAYVVSAWDDGTNLNVQINSGTVASATRPTVSAGSSTATIGKSNTSAASYFNGLMYQVLQTKNDGGTDAERTEAKAYCATKGGVTL